LQYLTKHPLFTTQCSFHGRQTAGSLCKAQNGCGEELHWQEMIVVVIPLSIFKWIYAVEKAHCLSQKTPPEHFNPIISQ